MLLEDFARACLSRALDDREITLSLQGRIHFQISSAGHEALLLALARHLRPAYDWFFPYYRDRPLLLGIGLTPEEMLLQAVGCAADPASGGRQMPSHWGSARLNVVTQSSPTGSQCLPAVGCAEAGRYIARRSLRGCKAHGDELTYVSLGEGAASQGEFWESLNTAARLHLPVLYVVEDNGYALSVRAEDQSPAPISEMVRGFRGLAITTIDGRDYFESWHGGAEAIARVRAGEGPGLIHAKVTRPYSHSGADTQSKYRPADELADEAAHDPIDLLEAELVAAGLLSPGAAEGIKREAKERAAAAAKAALGAPLPEPSSITDHVMVIPDIREARPASAEHCGEPVTVGAAINAVLHELMAVDERIRVFGEDVADAPEALLEVLDGKGGVFGTTHGLQKAFGVARCFNTPLAEANIVGRAVGQATLWFRGRTEEAGAARDAALALARDALHPYTGDVAFVFALVLAADMEERPRFVDLLDRATASDGGRERSWVVDIKLSGMRGYAEVIDGRTARGIERIRGALEATGPRNPAPGFRAVLLRLLVGACAMAGEVIAGLDAAEEGLRAGGTRLWEPEIRRIRAELLAAHGHPAADVAAELARAEAAARGQGAVGPLRRIEQSRMELKTAR